MSNQAGIEIRVLGDLGEFRDTLAVQSGVWKFSELDQVPPRILSVAKYIGGLILGAFDGDRMVGFSFALPGAKRDGSGYWHSHMTGVLDDYQGLGIGRLIKLKQREEALAAGIDRIEWFFDPLEIRNAHFNIEKLGVIVQRFLPNQYGITSSPLHGGLPTDRLVADWHLSSPSVTAIIEGRATSAPRVEKTIDIPAEIAELRAGNPEKAKAIQTNVREQFQQSFREGLTVTRYRRSEAGGAFQLARIED